MLTSIKWIARWRWALPFYLLAVPFEAIVVLSALQVVANRPGDVMFIQLGRAHPLPVALFSLLSVLSALLAWRLDRAYRHALVPRPLPGRRLELDPASVAPSLELDIGFEEPTMILHAVAVPAESAPSRADDAPTADD